MKINMSMAGMVGGVALVAGAFFLAGCSGAGSPLSSEPRTRFGTSLASDSANNHNKGKNAPQVRSAKESAGVSRDSTVSVMGAVAR